jgi:asparagine synthase (glutamine-hydrolysing)
MSDFYLDLRSIDKRTSAAAIAERMRYCSDMNAAIIEKPGFLLCVAAIGAQKLWGIYERKNPYILVAVSGRIAADASQWETARAVPGEGGLAAKIVYGAYAEQGIDAVTGLNGGFVVLLYDGARNTLYIVTDRSGSHPCFSHSRLNVFSSHPDILAYATGEQNNIDTGSVAEFIKTGRLSHPYTYYNALRSLDSGSVYTIPMSADSSHTIDKKRYFQFNFAIDHSRSEWDIAEEMKKSFTAAITRRTLPLFGQSAISLSGGLDSRAITGALPDRGRTWSFCFFDRENREFSVAKKVAQAAGMKFIPLKRTFDHYGDNAAQGIRIAGGMGDFGNNHYLGFRKALMDEGIENIITGFYCDYMFKGLVLDKVENKWLRRERLAPFRYESYMPMFTLGAPHDEAVLARLETVFPATLRNDKSPVARLEIERRRFFPLCYEPDHMETIVPLRVLGWYLPTIDNDLLDTYLKIPPSMKLNTSMYAKMVYLICGKKLSSIENVNTGARVNASPLEIMLLNNIGALRRKINVRRKPDIATEESWPNWEYYLNTSKKIRAMWGSKNDEFRDLLSKVTSVNPSSKSVEEFCGRERKLFLRLLTLKLWLENRIV